MRLGRETGQSLLLTENWGHVRLDCKLDGFESARRPTQKEERETTGIAIGGELSLVCSACPFES